MWKRSNLSVANDAKGSQRRSLTRVMMQSRVVVTYTRILDTDVPTYASLGSDCFGSPKSYSTLLGKLL